MCSSGRACDSLHTCDSYTPGDRPGPGSSTHSSLCTRAVGLKPVIVSMVRVRVRSYLLREPPSPAVALARTLTLTTVARRHTLAL